MNRNEIIDQIMLNNIQIKDMNVIKNQLAYNKHNKFIDNDDKLLIIKQINNYNRKINDLKIKLKELEEIMEIDFIY